MKVVNEFLYYIKKNVNAGTAFIGENIRIEWKNIEESCIKICFYLESLHIDAKDTVILLVENTIEWTLLFTALNIMRVNIALIHHEIPENELLKIKKIINANYILDKKELSKIKLFLNENIDDNRKLLDFDNMSDKSDLFSNYIILCSSGTYSTKKRFVYHTQKNFWGSVELLNNGVQVESSDIIEAALPMNHILGLTCQVFLGFLTGAALSFPKNRSVKEITNNLIREKVTVLNGVPTLFRMIMEECSDRQLECMCVRKGIIGGDKYKASFFLEVVNKLGINKLVPSLGSTETGIITSGNVNDLLELRAMSVGKPSESIQVKIIDSGGKTIKKDMVEGELVIKTPYLFKGVKEEGKRYIENKQKWYRTGDMVKCWNNNLIYVSRKKEIIIRGGININLKNLEERCCLLFKNVQVKCLGMKNELYGEVAVAFIKLLEQHSMTDICNIYNEKFVKNEKPDVLIFVNEIPTTTSYKIKAEGLQKLLDDQIKEKIYLLKKDSLIIDLRL